MVEGIDPLGTPQELFVVADQPQTAIKCRQELRGHHAGPNSFAGQHGPVSPEAYGEFEVHFITVQIGVVGVLLKIGKVKPGALLVSTEVKGVLFGIEVTGGGARNR